MHLSNKLKIVLEGIVILVLFLFVQVVVSFFGTIVSIVVSAIYTNGEFDYNALLSVITPYFLLISEILCIIVFGIWYYVEYVRNKSDKKNSGVKNICDFRSLGFITSTSLAAFSIALLISHFVSAIWPASNELFNKIMGTALGNDSIVSYLCVMLLAPISEELAFRGVLLQKSKKIYGMIGCIVLNTILFAIMHLNPLQFLYVLPVGALLTYLAYKYKTVIASVIAHIINNTVGVLIPLFLHREPNNIETMVLLILAVVIAFILRDKPKALKSALQVGN